MELEILERLESGVGNFGKGRKTPYLEKVEVGVGYFTSDTATLLAATLIVGNLGCFGAFIENSVLHDFFLR